MTCWCMKSMFYECNTCNAIVLPELVTPFTLCCPRAHNTIIHPKPMTPLTPCHPQARNIILLPEFATLSTPRCPQACSFAVLTWQCVGSCSAWCYGQSAPSLLHIFLCHFGPTNLEFDMLHRHIALICYSLLHCFDMLYWHITMICYTLLRCFCSSTFLSMWVQTTLLNDKCGLSEMSVTTWTNIVLLRFQLRTTWNK
jgi:hypothetical protein